MKKIKLKEKEIVYLKNKKVKRVILENKNLKKLKYLFLL
jgi:hypothetical protein